MIVQIHTALEDGRVVRVRVEPEVESDIERVAKVYAALIPHLRDFEYAFNRIFSSVETG